jgi:hypothetical protein
MTMGKEMPRRFELGKTRGSSASTTMAILRLALHFNGK